MTVQTKDGTLLNLPIACGFVGLGYYPYMPYIEPDKDPERYGYRKGLDNTYYNRAGDRIRLYIPPGEFYYTRIEPAPQGWARGAKRRFRKQSVDAHMRDAHFDYLSSQDFISGSEILAYRIGKDLYEDVSTAMPLKIPDELMCISP